MRKRLNRVIWIWVVVLLITVPVLSQSAFNLRTLTAGVTMNREGVVRILEETHDFLEKGRKILTDAGFNLEGVRMSTNPFPDYTRNLSLEETVAFIKVLSDFAGSRGIGLSIGPGIIDDDYDEKVIEKICAIIPATAANTSLIIASKEIGIHRRTIRAAAETIKRLSEIDPLANFNFTALANVPSEIPFFLAAYHDRSRSSFAIGTESAKLVMYVFSKANDPNEAESVLAEAFDREFSAIELAAERIRKETGWIFEGVDTSPAPLGEISIGRAIEDLLGAPFGSPGTLSVCSLITRVIKGTDVKQAGYCGLMLPVMEDVVLAKRASEGYYGLDDLMSYSAVCGTGLDVLPLPGDVSIPTIENILLDVASVALTLDKPLSARLILLPGKKTGDEVKLDSPFLFPTRVIGVRH